MKMFGVMDLNNEFSEGRYSIGLRNSNDKSMRLALTAGYRVFVCDNMAFSGDFTPLLHKHTRNLALRDSISIAVDRIHRGFDNLEERITAMRQFMLTDNDARLFIYQAFVEGRIKAMPKHLLPDVHENYFTPGQDEFRPRNLWSLSNAFTSAFKQLAPIKHFEVTAKLGTYLSQFQENLKHKEESQSPFSDPFVKSHNVTDDEGEDEIGDEMDQIADRDPFDEQVDKMIDQLEMSTAA
jgi:hypothetical protein